MKMKWGALVVDGRGKIGGQVASKNKSGAYLKNKVSGTNPQTQRQTAARQLFAQISSSWGSLSDAQRAAWDAASDEWARSNVFGDQVGLTGKALFQRLNNQAQSAGYPAVTTVPDKDELPSGVLTAAAFDTSGSTLTLTGVSTSADCRIMVFATTKLSSGTRFVRNKLRLIYTAPGDSYVAADAYTEYVNRFGAPASGDNIFVGIKYVIANGQASPRQSVNASIS